MGRSALVVAVLGALALGAAAFADEAADKQWTIRTARMEGAAVNVREASDEVGATARRIAESGRLHSLSELGSDMGELNRRVVSAKLAAEVLDEGY